MKEESKPALFKKWHLFVLTGIISTLLLFGGYFFYSFEEKSIRKEKYQEIQAIAELKINQIIQWRNERLGDAIIVTQTPIFNKQIEQWLSHINNLTLKKDILKRLTLSKENKGYEDIVLSSPQGDFLLSLDPKEKTFDTITSSNIRDAIEKRQITFTDFYYCPSHRKIHFDITAPVVDDQNIVIAALLFRIDPNDYLYPLIQKWPTPSKTAETLLLRRDGESVLYLNELRHKKNTALKLRISLTKKEIPAVQAVLGYKGYWEGYDYRGIKVVSDVQPIPGTPWFMVVKVDKSEIYSELYFRSAIISIFTLVLICLLAIGLFWILHYRQRNIYRELFVKEKELRETQEEFKTLLAGSEIRYRRLFEAARDGILILNAETGIIVDVNPFLIELLGCTKEQFIEKAIWEIGFFKDIVSNQDNFLEIQKMEYIRYEDLPLTIANGKKINVEFIINVYLVDNKKVIQCNIRDVTERKLAEKTLRESEVKLKVILESTADGILAVDGEGKIIKTNKRFAELWRIPQLLIDSKDDDALLNFVLEQLTDPEKFISKVKKLYNSTDEDLDQLYFKDGRIFERFSKPLLMGDSSIGRVWSFHDITKRTQAEGMLQNERLLLRTLVDNIPDSIYSKDLACRKTLANLTDLNYLGAKSEADILGKDDFDFYPKELAEKFIADDQAVMQSGKPILNKEEYVIDENGHQRWLLTSKIPLKDKKGNITGIVGIGRDITERKRAEEKIQKSNEQFRMVWNGTLDGMRIMDENGKIISVNDAFCNMVLLTREQLIGLHFSALFHKGPDEISDSNEQNSKMEVYKQRFSEKKIEPKFERELHLWDDRKVWFEVTNAYMEIDENKNVLLSVFRDITKRKQNELIIQQQNSNLQELNASKDKFFSIIAHDLKSPFLGLLGLTEIIAMEDENFTKADLLAYGKDLHKSTSNLFKLLENLLEWAQIQRGTISFTPQNIDLFSLAKENTAIINQRALQKGITIINKVSERESVFADEKMVDGILRNLLSNAVKFTRRDGKVIIQTKEVDAEMLEVSISDTGVGISEKIIKRLFKIEEKVGSKGTDDEPSTGLGLFLCKEFVEKNGGKIWVESKENVGSTFYFTLPKVN